MKTNTTLKDLLTKGQISAIRKGKANGYILHEDRVRVIIAIGFKRASKNIKTGKMIQVFIIRKDMDPVSANRTGKDSAICGSCPLKGGKGQARTCYVTLVQAPLAVYKAYKRGSYPVLQDFHIFNNREVRFGAYGDPVFIPFGILSEIANRARTWTGYTHQWQNPLFSGYRNFLMASVESAAGMEKAHSEGWRTFRVVGNGTSLESGEIMCVNETRGVQCIKCGLCKGASIGAKSIAITVHGTGKGNFGTN